MTQVAILGAGITGLSAGWLLMQSGIDFIVLEKEPMIGGLARSFEWHGFDCDIGAHRLFIDDEDILKQLRVFAPLRRHQRRSRIYLQGKWLQEPLSVLELAQKLPTAQLASLLWQYSIRPRNISEDSFENYVVRRYGKALNRLFFAPYTEKLFGIPGKEISAMWAWKKVRLASPFDPFYGDTRRKFSHFHYPVEGGYGSIAMDIYQQIKDRVLLESEVSGFEHNGGQIVSVSYRKNDQQFVVPVERVISTLPLDLVSSMLGFTSQLRYKKLSAVYLLARLHKVSENHWIYFVDGNIAINRLVEFKNFSANLDPIDATVLCAEVTWDGADLTGRVISDLGRVGLLEENEIEDVRLVQEEYAYPMYDQAYEETYPEILNTLSRYWNIHQAGRTAEFSHLEADDSFAAAMKAVDWANRRSSLQLSASGVDLSRTGHTCPRRIFVVILSYNHYEDTYECLESVFASNYKDFEVVLVDNGSSDGTIQKVCQDFPGVCLIQNGSNLGVPAGYNVGFNYALSAGAEYILLLNNDTVVSPDMLTQLLIAADNDPGLGIVMPRILFYGGQGEIWSSGGRYRRFPPAILMTDRRKSVEAHSRMIEFAPGCGLLIHRRAFERAGLFDPGFFFLFDDWDFSKRVREQGLNIWHESKAVMWHKVSRTTQGPCSPLFWQTFGASSVRFYRKHGRAPWISLVVHVGYLILREFVWKRNWEYWEYFRRGMCEGLKSTLTHAQGETEVASNY